MQDMSVIYIVAFIAAGVLFIFIKHKIKLERIAKRRAYLMSKYGDENIVKDIMAGLIWQDMTAEQLIDSWGNPTKIDSKIYKTKTKHTYKYNPIGRRQYGQRVIVENDIVVGWDNKSL